jgi:PTH2 family peptidyl-tRNA hydrolase
MKMYILVNKDIEMTIGKTAGQVGHAITNYLLNSFASGDKYEEIILWHNKGKSQTKIILKAKQSILEELEKEGYNVVRDNGLTELAPNTLTAVCLGIGEKEAFIEKHKWFKRLQLL